MKRLGLGYKVLKKVKLDVIMLSTSMQGQMGPRSLSPGCGVPLTALTGFNYIANWPDRDMVGLDTYTDFIAPQFNALSVLAAILYKRRTGKGQFLDFSQYEGYIHSMAPLILDYIVNRWVDGRMVNCSTYAAPHGVYCCLGDDQIMEENGGGKIINISSVSGLKVQVPTGNYSIAKAGVIMMTEVMVLEWAQYNVRVNCIAPGAIETRLYAASFSLLPEDEAKERREVTRQRIPMKRVGEPGEIADSVLFLASEASSYVRGRP